MFLASILYINEKYPSIFLAQQEEIRRLVNILPKGHKLSTLHIILSDLRI